MSEFSELPVVQGADVSAELSAGALLKQARQAQGLHIAALAAQLKVSQRKLEALESDQHEELQGVAFVRALAQAACRVLKVDAAPVLARLPQVEQRTLDRVSGGLNEPFHEKGARQDVMALLKAGRGLLLAVAVLLVAASLLWFLPPGFSLQAWLPQTTAPTAQPDSTALTGAGATVPGGAVLEQPGAASAGEGSVIPPAAASSAEPPVTSAPPVSEGVGASPTLAASQTAGLLGIRTSAASWIEVSDARGTVLLARTMTAGEALNLDPVLPVRLKIGNAAVTELRFRGKALDLSDSTRDNVARIELN